jgi:GT2 family glycosyltransferase
MGKGISQLPVSVVIPTWNSAQFVDRVLTALTKLEGAEYEIVVVDNGVVNRETELVAERHRQGFPALRYLKFEKQLGYAGAVNAGTREAKHPLVAVMNNDNIPDPAWLAELLKVFQAESKDGSSVIVGSLVDRPGFPRPLECRSNLWARIVRVGTESPHIFHPDGSAFLFDRRVFPVPYDDDYFVYQEDVALGWRAWLEGHRVLLAPASRAESFDGGNTRRIAYKTAFFTERNRWINYVCFLSPWSLVRALPLLLCDLLLKLISGSNRRPKLHAWAWLLGHPTHLLQKRKVAQKGRRRADAEILPHLSLTYLDIERPGAGALNLLFRGMNLFLRLPLGR